MVVTLVIMIMMSMIFCHDNHGDDENNHGHEDYNNYCHNHGDDENEDN